MLSGYIRIEYCGQQILAYTHMDSYNPLHGFTKLPTTLNSYRLPLRCKGLPLAKCLLLKSF